ncbi:hypothetical protein KY348_02440 [Candidatus Woesearchaeota archaeon]|nr:hypothetical protein [Candidatus Woesearchaeota archaeon]
MAEGVEIVIKPIHLERIAYSIVIIALAVLLVIKWGGGSDNVADNETTGALLAEAGMNETNQTVNASQEANLCSNSVKDQDETDVDCGGSKCDPCGEFKFCNIDSDCIDGWCRSSVKCVTPACDDGEKNQDESNVDCGGVCGGFFYDGACHDEPEPSYSGRVDLTILEVVTSITEFDDEQFAKIESVEFKVENGKDKDVVLTAYIYARDSSGSAYFLRSVNDEEVPMATFDVPILATGESHTESIEIKRTLPETEPDEEYRVVIELRDDDDELERKATWENV